MSSEFVDYEISGGNVFEDLGLPHAPELRVKARLAHQISQIIEQRAMTQTRAAAVLGIDQPKVSALVRGRLEKFSIERLCDYLRALGCEVEIQISQKKKLTRGKLMTTEQRAMDIVQEFEAKQGREPVDVSRSRSFQGYDIHSGSRKIEVKGITESWATCNWQSMTAKEVKCLKDDPDNFYLYIVKFDNSESGKYSLYIIPGRSLLDGGFKLVEVASFVLSGINQNRLKQFLAPDC